MSTLPVSEVYGPVFQGEGRHTGTPVYFVRLGLCNLRCSWCDTPYTWDTSRFDVAAECPPMTPGQVAAKLPNPNVPVVLSGGEPLIHQRTTPLLELLEAIPNDVHVETNGTVAPSDYMRRRVRWWSVSPKVNDQGDPASRRIRPDALAAFAGLARDGRVGLKVVCSSPADVIRAVEAADEHGFQRRDVWVMPEGTDPDQLLTHASAIEDTALTYGLNLTLRQHVLLHGSERLR